MGRTPEVVATVCLGSSQVGEAKLCAHTQDTILKTLHFLYHTFLLIWVLCLVIFKPSVCKEHCTPQCDQLRAPSKIARVDGQDYGPYSTRKGHALF